MFNFFGELKNKIADSSKLDLFHIVNVSNNLIYAEGQKGIVTLSGEVVSFKVKGGLFVVEGTGLYLVELTENTIKIGGKIKKVEFF